MTESEWHYIQPTDPRPTGHLTHVRLVEQGVGWQIHRWRDELGQLWDIGPGTREYAGCNPQES